jgi:hypothetical protein
MSNRLETPTSVFQNLCMFSDRFAQKVAGGQSLRQHYSCGVVRNFRPGDSIGLGLHTSKSACRTLVSALIFAVEELKRHSAQVNATGAR